MRFVCFFTHIFFLGGLEAGERSWEAVMEVATEEMEAAKTYEEREEVATCLGIAFQERRCRGDIDNDMYEFFAEEMAQYDTQIETMIFQCPQKVLTMCYLLVRGTLQEIEGIQQIEGKERELIWIRATLATVKHRTRGMGVLVEGKEMLREQMLDYQMTLVVRALTRRFPHHVQAIYKQAHDLCFPNQEAERPFLYIAPLPLRRRLDFYLGEWKDEKLGGLWWKHFLTKKIHLDQDVDYPNVKANVRLVVLSGLRDMLPQDREYAFPKEAICSTASLEARFATLHLMENMK